MPKRNSIWMWIAVALGLVALLAIVFLPSPTDPWAHVRLRIAELEAEARSRNVPRSVLVGTAIPGNAWDEYGVVMLDALDWEDVDLPWLLQFAFEGKGTRAPVEKAIAAHSEALKHVFDGAQRSDGQYPYRWEDFYALDLPRGGAALKVAGLAGGQARILLESGRAKEAANALFALATFGRDYTAHAFLSTDFDGGLIYSLALNGIRDLLLSGRLSKDDASEIALKLEIMEREFPKISPVLVNDMWSTGTILMQYSKRELTAGSWLEAIQFGGWRYALAPRNLAADSFALKDEFMKRALKLDKLDYAEARKESAAIKSEASASSNPVLQRNVPDLVVLLESHRDIQARLRLLQAAAQYRAAGKAPSFPDPFGTTLFAVEDGNKIRIWSVGPDGSNHNGVGGWQYQSATSDIVLEMPK